MKKENMYWCNGFSYRNNNWHLSGMVGNTHTIKSWLKIAFPNKDESFLNDYFDGWKDQEIADYLYRNMAIRLTKI